MVKGALPGQTVSCMISKVRKDKAEARLLDVLEKSEIEDAAPQCPQFGICGGCTYQTLSYANQLTLKADQVKKNFWMASLIQNNIRMNGTELLALRLQLLIGTKWNILLVTNIRMDRWFLVCTKKNSMYDIVPVCDCVIVSEGLQ